MSSEAPAGTRRSLAPLIIGGVLFVAAAGFLGWWLTRGDELATLRGHTGPVRAVAYVWASPDRSPPRELKAHKKHVHGLAFLPDGRTLLSAGEDGSLRFWNLADGTTEATIEVGKRHVHGIAVSALSGQGRSALHPESVPRS